jgi:hypothetical protein
MGTRPEFDAYIEKHVGYALTGIIIADPKTLDTLRFQIGHVLRQVERDARGVACASIYACANEVNDNRPV